MSKFQRGITKPEFIQALNRLRQDPYSYWSKMVEDGSLFVAIRHDCINVYYKGNSICKLSYNNGQVTAKVHYKYLLNPQIVGDSYVETRDGRFADDVLCHKSITALADVDLLKRASGLYAGEEKSGVHSVITGEKNVLDVEITFAADDDSSKNTDRIDYLKLERGKAQDSDIRLVFYEAKHFTNKEIRSVGRPDVLEQIDAYEKALKQHKESILDSYALVCRNLQELDLIGERDLLGMVASGEGRLSIDFNPRLIVFGFDQDQKAGEIWKGHRAKLSDALGKRLITRGNA